MWSPHGEEGTSRRQSGCREEGATLAVPRLRALSEPSAGPHPLSEPQPFSAPETQARRPSGQARSLPRSTVSASRSQTLRGRCLPQAPSGRPLLWGTEVSASITRQPNPVYTSELFFRASRSLLTGFGLKGQEDRDG